MEIKYHSFLLRLWTTDQQNGEYLWRASLESPETGRKKIFSSVEELIDFLETVTHMPSAPRGSAEGNISH